MHRISRSCAAIIGLAVVAADPLAAVQAEEYVSQQYGFRFRVPYGFYERTDNMPMTLKMFAEDEETTEGYLITIHIQHLGHIVDPAQRLDPQNMPKKEGFVLTPEIRRWQDVELQAVKQEVTIEPDLQFVGYLIQFPLKDVGIQLRVQGPKSRADQVRKVFDQSVESFVNLEPYIVRITEVHPGNMELAIAKILRILLPMFVLAPLLIWFVFLIRKSNSKS